MSQPTTSRVLKADIAPPTPELLNRLTEDCFDTDGSGFSPLEWLEEQLQKPENKRYLDARDRLEIEYSKLALEYPDAGLS